MKQMRFMGVRMPASAEQAKASKQMFRGEGCSNCGMSMKLHKKLQLVVPTLPGTDLKPWVNFKMQGLTRVYVAVLYFFDLCPSL